MAFPEMERHCSVKNKPQHPKMPTEALGAAILSFSRWTY